MTTVAFDGRYFAADSCGVCDGIYFKMGKIHILDDMVVSGCGNTESILTVVDWLKDQSKPKPTGFNDDILLLEVNRKTKKSCLVGASLIPEEFVFGSKPGINSIGSGAKAAMASMLLGQNAIAAIHYACEIDIYSRPPIYYVDLDADILEIKEFQKRKNCHEAKT